MRRGVAKTVRTSEQRELRALHGQNIGIRHDDELRYAVADVVDRGHDLVVTISSVVEGLRGSKLCLYLPTVASVYDAHGVGEGDFPAANGRPREEVAHIADGYLHGEASAIGYGAVVVESPACGRQVQASVGVVGAARDDGIRVEFLEFHFHFHCLLIFL